MRPVDQSGCVHLARQCWSVAHLWAAASKHIILIIFTAAGLTKLSPDVQYKALLLLDFAKQHKKKHALLYYGSKFLLLKLTDNKYAQSRIKG